VSGFDLTLDSSRRLARVEVINGAGGRRRWSADDKARILEETLVPGAVVSEVAHRHGLRPQQLFGWRRDARLAPDGAGEARTFFVPAVVEVPAPAATLPRPRPEPRPRGRARPRSPSQIEMEIEGVVVRVGPAASSEAIAAVVRALKAGA